MKYWHVVRNTLDLTLTKLNIEPSAEYLICVPLRRDTTIHTFSTFTKEISRVKAASRDADVLSIGAPKEKRSARVAEASGDCLRLLVYLDSAFRVALPLDSRDGDGQRSQKEAACLLAALGALADATQRIIGKVVVCWKGDLVADGFTEASALELQF